MSPDHGGEKIMKTIRRTDGTVETMIHQKVTEFTPSLLAQANIAMKTAGRGEIISYRNIPAEYEMEESDHYTRCTHCGQTVDMRTSYHQAEKMRCGGSLVTVDRVMSRRTRATKINRRVMGRKYRPGNAAGR